MPLIEITYDESYFQGKNVVSPHPAGYDDYAEPNYRDTDSRVNQLVTKAQEGNLPIAGRKVLVLGCAYGYLVKHLVSLGVDAYGMDISEFAVSQAPSEIASRIFVGDARLEASYQQAKTLAGLSRPNDKFDLIIDEEMIVCLIDSDAITFCNLGKKYSSMFYHLVDVSPHLAQWYNLKTLAEWKALIGTSPKEKWFTCFTWGEE